MEKILAMSLGLVASGSLAAFASSPHPPTNGNHGVGFLYPTAGAVSYKPGKSTGLSAVYAPSLNFGVSHLPGYILTGSSAGQVGWNIPSVAGGNATVPQFYGAKVYIASSTNFSGTVPFKIVAQSADGVNHTCTGTQGTYRFNPAQAGSTAYSSFTAFGTQFTPSLGLGDTTVQKITFIFTGTGTAAFCGGVEQGGNTQITPGHYSYATTPDTKFNFQ